MQNITKQQPTDPLYGRTRFSASFVERRDIAGKRCLDIGCGYGWMELVLLKKGAASVTGTELRDDDLVTARHAIHSRAISFSVGSAIGLPFPDRAFDSVISWEVIEHIPKCTEQVMFREVCRVLKPKGVFYLSTPYRSISAVFDPAYWLIGHRHYTKRTLINIATENGFRLSKIEIRGGWWEIVGLLDLYIGKWIFHRKPFFQAVIEKKQDAEFQKPNGFTNIFLKFVKESRRTSSCV